MRQVSVQALPRTPDVVRGALAAVAIVALVAGVPWALSTFVGWPLPSSIPSWSEITTALGDSYIPDTFLAKALAVVCWVVWIELMATLAVEAVAVVRGRQAGRVPLTGPVQRLVARLVAAVSLMVILLLTRPDRTAQAVPVPPPAATAGVLVSGAEPIESVGERSTASYVVQQRDTLWGIAETYLSDPFRWVEIWERNQNKPQPDGATMVDPDRIYPGWVLDLPDDAARPGPAAVEPSSTPGGGTEAMTSLSPDAGSSGDAGATTLLVSDAGSGDRMEIMVPLGPRLEPAEPDSLLAAESHDGAVPTDRSSD